MNWKEDWRKVKRPHASEIPERYALWPAGTDRLLVVYFAVVFLLTYLGLEYLGTQAVLVAGLPMLMVVTAGVSFLFIVGLLLMAYRSERKSRNAPSKELSE
jgi:preprotein translocase subunit SecG